MLVLAIGLIAAAVVDGAASPGTPGASPPRATVAAAARPAVARAAAAPHLVVTAPRAPGASWTVVAQVHGQPAAWIAQRSGVTLMRFDQRLVHLTLHAGSSDGGVVGWTYGDQITPREIHLVRRRVQRRLQADLQRTSASCPADTSPSR